VRFADAVKALADAGASRYIEVGPGSTASAMIAATLDTATVVPLLRRNGAEASSLLTALGEAFVAGVGVDWSGLFAGIGARAVDLPTYPFARTHFWMSPARRDVADSGLTAVSHPILTAVIEQPDSGGVRMTGRVSLSRQPWLADHRIHGHVLFPATGFVDLALLAGAECGCPVLRELTVQAPLVIPASTAVTVQVSVDADHGAGERSVTVYASADGSPWTCHAAGVVAQGDAEAGFAGFDAWPPEGATEIGIADVYDLLAGAGYEYGPAFRGLRRAWQRGDEVFAEAALGDIDGRGDGFIVHPALLDAVLHAHALAPASGEHAVALPFAWEDVVVHGTMRAAVRARITPAGADRMAVDVTDDVGLPVVSVRSMAMRSAARNWFDPSLHVVDWHPLPVAAASRIPWATWPDVPDPVPGVVVADFRSRCAPPGLPSDVQEAATTALALVQEWMGDKRFARSTLLVVTSGAVGADVTDLAGASVWGLIRSAQAEDPGRFVLADVDGDTDIDDELVARVTAAGEPQLVVHGAEISAARLRRMDPVEERATPVLTGGTVLITGGTGMLGTTLARHLVAVHGVRDLVLTGRRAGGTAIVDELAAAGARVRIEQCDVTDRAAVDRLVAAIEAERPLVGVVHAAGVLDDGVVTSLTPQRLAAVLAPKVRGAWNLHEATVGARPAMFALFSSAAGVLGAPGQANYAAANAYLDALGVYRQMRGLPAVSMAWGPWAGAGGMASTLDEMARMRTARSGIRELPADVALAGFDEALASGRPVVVPVRVNLAAVERSTLPPILAALGPRRRRALPAPAGPTIDLGALLPDKRRAMIVELVREHAAAVLGHTDRTVIELARPFQEMGFDSLGAVEFRNRMKAATGVNLPPTAVFDYPTPGAIGDFIAGEFTGPGSESDAGRDQRFPAAQAVHPIDGDGIDGGRAELIRDMDEESLIRMVLGDEERSS
jgi:acyl transferase domain-containing protein/acyl carrier protein